MMFLGPILELRGQWEPVKIFSSSSSTGRFLAFARTWRPVRPHHAGWNRHSSLFSVCFAESGACCLFLTSQAICCMSRLFDWQIPQITGKSTKLLGIRLIPAGTPGEIARRGSGCKKRHFRRNRQKKEKKRQSSVMWSDQLNCLTHQKRINDLFYDRLIIIVSCQQGSIVDVEYR